ncbi:MAG: mannonate dehydratase, partial [Miniphocaeibacter sp.]|uniref:mannonate dehydratase n=1 Tax=Miniphocaeibacter sp. TaxID=3100973 RepID=UPI003BAF4894
MKMTFRWYGKNTDAIPLKYIKQIPNCTGIMGMLDDIPAGEIWSEERIKEYVDYVNKHGLEVEVIESVNVHEDIKLGL